MVVYTRQLIHVEREGLAPVVEDWQNQRTFIDPDLKEKVSRFMCIIFNDSSCLKECLSIANIQCCYTSFRCLT